MDSFLIGAGIVCSAFLAVVVEQSKSRWVKWVALAGCIALIVFGVVSCSTKNGDVSKAREAGYQRGYDDGYAAAYEEIESGD